MPFNRLTVLTAASLAMPLAAAAEGWTTEDLGNATTEAACVAQAADMFDTFGDRYSYHSTATGGWTVAGYDLTEDDYDGLVTCAYGPDGQTRATLVVYSVGDADQERRREIAALLKEIWKE